MFAASKTNSASTGGYQISRSLRFNSADSAYLGRTPTSASNRKTWTWSGWVKRTKLGVRQGLFSCQLGAGLQFGFLDTDVFQMGTNAVYVLQSTQVFRDPSAYYHLVVSVDTTLASNRCKVYINGTQITAWGLNTFDSTIGQNVDTAINLNNDHALGQIGTSVSFLDGYMTEINFIDGQALTPSSFGAIDAQTGVWQPKAYSGSYGTNGFYVNFSDNSNTTAATLGKDYSGNGNNWIPFNFSVTAGAGNDSLVDSPTSYGTDTGVGGTVRGNYCTFNPLAKASQMTVRNGNLDCIADGSWRSTLSTFGMTTGKWYWEQSIVSGVNMFSGIAKGNMDTSSFIGYIDANGWGYYNSNGYKWNNGSGTAYGASVAAGDIVGIAFDADAGTLVFYKNGTSQGTAFSGLTSGPYFPAASSETQTVSINFGQRPFAYTAPSGFKALCTQNLPTPTIGATTATQAGKYFNTVTYTGTGSSLGVTGVGFQPDWVWLKNRSAGNNHQLFDAVRGVQKAIYSDLTLAESTNANALTAFGSDGFTLGSESGINGSGSSYVSWNWKANGSGSTNTAGQITSTVSANTTSGFSIVTFTADGTTKTVGHGLGVKPSLVIVKVRNAAGSWITMTDIINGSMQYSTLNSTAAFASIAYSAPTSSVFQYNDNNGNTQVAYCFASIEGYSKIGTYTGNGSADGPFVFTGMRPSYIVVKRTNTSGTSWNIYDTTRSPYNVTDDMLFANLSDAELANETSLALDILSNGFKLRTTGTSVNGSGDTYIYMAFASTPLKFSLAR